MTDLNRRKLLTSAVLSGAAVGAGLDPIEAVARPRDRAAGAGDAGAARTACVPPAGPATITAEDLRYRSVVDGHNHRFAGRPDYVRVVGTTGQVVDAIDEAVSAGKRVVVRSGGHCFENFTGTPDIRVLVDLSQMGAVSFHQRMRAFEIEAGATLGHVYRTLFKRWGVTVPGGSCFEVGVGGHIAGGGYGHLSRRYGLVADHLYALEVVVVDRTGKARVVVATREPDDPHRDLWWAHAGGGGGSLGVVTRYWLRSRNVTSADPALILPKAPAMMRRQTVVWPWESMTEQVFTRLVRNFCTWYEMNSAPDSPNATLWSTLLAFHRSAQVVGLIAVVDDSVPGGASLLAAHVEAVTAGVDIQPVTNSHQTLPWMTSRNWPAEPDGRYKHKAGDLRKGYTDRQIATIYRHLNMTSYTNPSAFLGLGGYGGQVNAIAQEATAAAQRDSILRAVYSTGNWESEDQDAVHLGWVREFYRDVYADTGGVPVANRTNAGTYINYADIDLADPTMNTSGVGWQTLYYGENYPRLQRIKKLYDPRNIFHHALAIELPGS